MLFCPVEIKRYASAFSLVDTERNHFTAHHNETEKIADKLKLLYGNMSRWERSLFLRPRLKPDLPNLGAGTSPDLQTGDQWGLGLIHIWEINNVKRPTLRIVTYVLFRLGILLLAIPAAFTFLQVTMVLARHLMARI